MRNEIHYAVRRALVGQECGAVQRMEARDGQRESLSDVVEPRCIRDLAGEPELRGHPVGQMAHRLNVLPTIAQTAEISGSKARCLIGPPHDSSSGRRRWAEHTGGDHG